MAVAGVCAGNKGGGFGLCLLLVGVIFLVRLGCGGVFNYCAFAVAR